MQILLGHIIDPLKQRCIFILHPSYRQHQVQDEEEQFPACEESFQLREGDHDDIDGCSSLSLFFCASPPLAGSTSAAGEWQHGCLQGPLGDARGHVG